MKGAVALRLKSKIKKNYKSRRKYTNATILMNIEMWDDE